MGGGYSVPATGDLGSLLQEISFLRQQIAELGRPSGGQVADQLATLQALVDGILTQVNGIFSGYVSAGGDITAGGTGTFNAGVTSIGVFNLDVSTLPGTRRTDWVNANGQVGYAPSSIVTKTNVDLYAGRAEQFLACVPVVFEYIGQIDIRDNPENVNYDPSYVVPLEVGLIAEVLIANGLPDFVFYDDDGTVRGIDYGGFAAIGFLIVGRDHETRLRRIELEIFRA